MDRRTFLKGSAAAAMAGMAAMTASAKTSGFKANEKLLLAGIGVGGQGAGDMRGLASCPNVEVVALCDVDESRAASSFELFTKKNPNVRIYKDYRVMLEKEKDIDAVSISTPDHTHAPAALMAMELGKAVRVQKPLTWCVAEARELTKAAKKYKVPTCMGNQGHAGDGVRQMCEIIWADTIGDVRECHIWTNRPVWPQGIWKPLPKEPVPSTMAWDLWIGTAPYRDYNHAYAPFNWRGWWDFGCGALGDMACHIMDPANWALQLGAPTSVECVYQEGQNEQTGPLRCIIKYEFPERKFKEPYKQAKWYGKTLPPVTVYWYDGNIWGDPKFRPDCVKGFSEEVFKKLGDGDNGSLFVGDKGIATTGCYGGGTRLVPDEKMADFKMPDPYIPRIKGGTYQEFVDAARGIRPAGARFEYAGPFTETVALGNVATRAGHKILWDAKRMKVTNCKYANRFLSREYRKGW